MIIDPENFCRRVEELHAHNDMSMFESVFAVCDDYGVDYEMVGPLVNRSIREKIKNEAIQLNLMKSDSFTLFHEHEQTN